MSLHVLSHTDSAVLETRLCEELKASFAGRALDEVWLVTPTRRLRRHLQRRLASEGSWLGLRFCELPTLVEQIAAHIAEASATGSTAAGSQRPIGNLGYTVLARQALEAVDSAGEWLAFDHAEASLLPGFFALREAGFRRAPRVAGLPSSTQLLLAAFDHWRQGLQALGWCDEWDPIEALQDELGPQHSLPSIHLFGFSELVGRWRRLVAALEGHAELYLYAHANGERSQEGFESAEAFLGRLLGRPEERGADSQHSKRIPLPDPTGRSQRPELARRSLRGARAELEEALRQVRTWHRQGVPLESIAILARSLDPYLPYLGPLLSRWGPQDHDDANRTGAGNDRHDADDVYQAGSRYEPEEQAWVDSPASLPLIHFPIARRWLAACETDPESSARALHTTLASTPQDAPASTPMETLVKALREVAHEVEQLVERLPQLDRRALAEEACRLKTVRPFVRADGAGLSILDFQQARGLQFRKVVLIGFHQGSFPRPVREDAWLPDRARQKLSAWSPDALPLREEQRQEEQLLLQLALRTASEDLVLLRQHANLEGAALARSPAERAVRRYLQPKNPEASEAVSGDPVRAAERRIRLGSATAGEAALALAQRGLADKSLEWLLRHEPASAKRFRSFPPWLQAVETFTPEDLSFDGDLSAVEHDFRAGLSVTGLEAYGRAPMAYFFERILEVAPRRGSSLPGPEPSRLGEALHALLAELHAERAPQSSLDEDLARAEDLFERQVAPLFEEDVEAHRDYLQHEARRWLQALREFLTWDLRRLHEAWNPKDKKVGGGPWQLPAESLERALHGATQFGKHAIEFRARIDRLLQSPSEWRVSDYKTGRIQGVSEASDFLRGTHLQNALYLLLLEEHEPQAAGLDMSAEAVRISPAVDYASKTATAGKFGSGLGSGDWALCREGVRETIAVLLDHLERGLFPPFRDPRQPWDGWFATMRHGHEATVQRVLHYEGWQALFQLMRKQRGRKADGSDGVFLLAQLVPEASGSDEDQGR